MLLSPLVSQTLGTFLASENAADLAVLRELIEAGRVTPAVDRTYPLDQTPAAIRYLPGRAGRRQAGRHRGRLTSPGSAGCTSPRAGLPMRYPT